MTLCHFSVVFLAVPNIISIFAVPNNHGEFVPRASVNAQSSKKYNGPFIPSTLSFAYNSKMIYKKL